ncbi:hypothetical protein Goshw_017738 [Gossypium schwendimanii]|uniref:RNase H type-1 domain-containing protein n=3 Tax=Gossypium TaxID=3633 RepID=A0A7J9MKB2_GOSSC|nr:hypothetical protein [Gossypium schwendimanii]
MRAICDSKTVGSNYSLIRRIQQILSQEGQWFLRHTPRENNQVVDGLAKMTFGKKEGLCMFDVSHPKNRLVN